jgi:hypothetical protein
MNDKQEIEKTETITFDFGGTGLSTKDFESDDKED